MTMKRALSSPLLWMRSPSTPRERTGSIEQFGLIRPAVHWEDTSEDESPKDSRQFAKSFMRVRRFSSMSPGLRADLDPTEVDVGVASRLDVNSPVFVSRSTPDALDKRGMRMVSVIAGHGGTTCAKFVSENLARDVVLALETSDDDLGAAMTTSFQTCDRGYKSQYANEPSGCCAMVALIYKRTICLAWSGECRAVLCCGNEIKPLSWEHHLTNSTERKRVLDAGGLIMSGQILGILPTSRGFGDNDVTNHLAKGVVIPDPSITSHTIDEATASSRLCFLILASHSVFEALGNEAACKIVTRALVRSDHNATVAADKLVRAAEKRTTKTCGAAVIFWCESTQRSRSSSATSWRSLRSFSTHEPE